MASSISLLLMVTFLADIGQLRAQANNDSPLSTSDQSENNIAFDLPDLTAVIDTPGGGEFQIEAYKSTSNDRILTADRAAASRLLWVSVGQPTFIKTPAPGTQNVTATLFHFRPGGFYTYVQTLTPAQRRLLASVANNKYGITVTDRQVVNLILSKFECTLVLLDDLDNKYLIKGVVSNFRHFPLRMNFRVPRNSIEMKLFREQLTGSGAVEPDFQFACNIASKGKLLKTNTLIINLEQMQQIELVDKIFGQGQGSNLQPETVYITRSQMTDLASEMYSTLNIVEDYQMTESQFTEAFVTELVSQVVTTQFTMIPIDTALESLSKYSFNFGDDLRPDVIKRDIGSIIKVERFDNKSHIKLDEAKLREVENTYKQSAGGNAGFLGITASANWARENVDRAKTEDKSLGDQLRQLNIVSENQIFWAIEGDRVVPKTLNVARLSRARFGRSLIFNRVRLQTFNAAFDRKFELYTLYGQNQATTRAIDQMREDLIFLRTKVNQDKVETNRQVSAVSTELTNIANTLRQADAELNSKIDSSTQSLSGTSNARPSTEAIEPPGHGAVTYIRWGRTVCPSHAQRLYVGYAGGSHFNHKGGGANYLCLPQTPEWTNNTRDGFQGWSRIYGAEYQSSVEFSKEHYSGPTFEEQDVPCAACHVPQRSAQIMIPALVKCPTGWTLEYKGYLVSEKDGHQSAMIYECMDEAPEVVNGGGRNVDGALMYIVEAECGSLPCRKYVNGWELSCVVCSK